ncbi:hypothetical protein HPP92_028931 [Vanilla planifolia]|uniref:Uncharacterized protein n=1 Tax=Vanilla planifolia TaxID=51239 RepID=A0A835P440_VANPL|nr:hypothetical protein HPP92_028931 [Vanilla planifolia]KAG0446262.1 hypothetical protein HPP92_028921 [Vanilla planifolia]
MDYDDIADHTPKKNVVPCHDHTLLMVPLGKPTWLVSPSFLDLVTPESQQRIKQYDHIQMAG